MKYRILATKVEGEILMTQVEYTFEDGSSQTIEVAHFAPKSKEEVIQGILNRGETEQAKRNATTLNQSLASSLLDS